MRFYGESQTDTGHAQSRTPAWDGDHKWCDCLGIVVKGRRVHAVDCQAVAFAIKARRDRSRRDTYSDDWDDPDDGEEPHRLGLFEWDDVFSPMDWGDN